MYSPSEELETKEVMEQIEPAGTKDLTEITELDQNAKASEEVNAAVNSVVDIIQSNGEAVPAEVHDAVLTAYYTFSTNDTTGNAASLMLTARQGIENAIAQGQQAGADTSALVDLNGQMERALSGAVQTQASGTTPNTTPTIEDLFLEYADVIGTDEMPSLLEFEQMYQEDGAVWNDLSLKKSYNEALRNGEIQPFTSFEEYKAMMEEGGNRASDVIKYKPNTDYKSTFFKQYPDLKGEVIVHHAVEQQVLARYEGVFTEEEIHALENLRGIPKELNNSLHLSKLRKEWNKFYREHPNPIKQDFLDFMKYLDKKYGMLFNPKLK